MCGSGAQEEEEEEEGEFVDRHSWNSLPPLAQTHILFAALLEWHRLSTAVFLPLLLYCPVPPLDSTWRGRHSEVSTARERLQTPAKASLKFIRAPPPNPNTHTQTSRGLLETNSNYRFCYSKSLTHGHFAQIQTHGIHFKPRPPCRRTRRSLVKNRI